MTLWDCFKTFFNINVNHTFKLLGKNAKHNRWYLQELEHRINRENQQHIVSVPNHNCACVVLIPLMWFCSFSTYCWCTMFYPSCDLYVTRWVTACKLIDPRTLQTGDEGQRDGSNTRYNQQVRSRSRGLENLCQKGELVHGERYNQFRQEKSRPPQCLWRKKTTRQLIHDLVTPSNPTNLKYNEIVTKVQAIRHQWWQCSATSLTPEFISQRNQLLHLSQPYSI